MEDVGADVSGLESGDMVLAPFVWADNTCDFCTEGLQTSCRHGGLWAVGDVDDGQGQAVRVSQAQGTLVKLPIGEDRSGRQPRARRQIGPAPGRAARRPGQLRRRRRRYGRRSRGRTPSRGGRTSRIPWVHNRKIMLATTSGGLLDSPSSTRFRPGSRARSRRQAIGAALPQLVAAARQVRGLRGVARQLDRFVVRRARLATAA